MKKLVTMMAVVMVGVMSLTSCGGNTNTNTTQTENSSNESNTTTDSTQTASGSAAEATIKNKDIEIKDGETLTGKHHIKIKVKKYGTMKLTLDADNAPITVTNFIKLANEGFYDGLTFHRIISGFMIQGGDPDKNGTGGSDQTIKGEFSQNGVENKISHKRGVISMARSQDPDSASSQFFIMHVDADYLDGQYAAFGKVTKGIEVVDKICQKFGSAELVPEEDQPVITSIDVID